MIQTSFQILSLSSSTCLLQVVLYSPFVPSCPSPLLYLITLVSFVFFISPSPLSLYESLVVCNYFHSFMSVLTCTSLSFIHAFIFTSMCSFLLVCIHFYLFTLHLSAPIHAILLLFATCSFPLVCIDFCSHYVFLLVHICFHIDFPLFAFILTCTGYRAIHLQHSCPLHSIGIMVIPEPISITGYTLLNCQCHQPVMVQTHFQMHTLP